MRMDGPVIGVAVVMVGMVVLVPVIMGMAVLMIVTAAARGTM